MASLCRASTNPSGCLDQVRRDVAQRLLLLDRDRDGEAQQQPWGSAPPSLLSEWDLSRSSDLFISYRPWIMNSSTRDLVYTLLLCLSLSLVAFLASTRCRTGIPITGGSTRTSGGGGGGGVVRKRTDDAEYELLPSTASLD
ncbi:uncharacterized protein PFL1_06326 [Pseudozyma flocculosa PF-1]|nr:uncharacterized protein PFL1_06326 [Pseudozyma flocculosa PF-1]EPQ26118.1 hypothetical protein PFL1_06326 [Pseudozyma flocculosa PF-1]